MNPNKRVKRLVRQYTKEWLELLGVDSWFEVTHKFIDGGEPDDDALRSTAADTTAAWEYRFAKIRWYLPNLANHLDADIEEVVVHEILHGLLHSMEQHVPEERTDHGEYAVETMTRALLAMRGALTSRG